MQLTKVLHSRLVAVAAGATIVGLLGAGAGWSAATITSSDIANDTIQSKDVKDGGLKAKDLSPGVLDGVKGQPGPAGPQGPQGPKGSAGAYVGPNWSIVDRNVIGNGDSYLRSGPATPPKGIGSLGIRTGGPADKASFGNQVDFLGKTLASINTVKYSVYTTGENNEKYAENGPSVAFEIDPSGPTNTAGLNFSTLVYVPVASATNAWTEQDASTAKRWFMTGQAGSGSCNQGPEGYCTLDEVKAKFASATLLTAQITKGRDYAFSGAVDGLVINSTTYDFEPFGVSESAH